MALSVPTFRTVRRTIFAGGRSVRISPTPPCRTPTCALQDPITHEVLPRPWSMRRWQPPFVRFVTLTV